MRNGRQYGTQTAQNTNRTQYGCTLQKWGGAPLEKIIAWKGVGQIDNMEKKGQKLEHKQKLQHVYMDTTVKLKTLY